MLLMDLPAFSCSRTLIERTSLAPRIVIPLSLQRDTRIFSSRQPKNLRNPRREKLPPQLGIDYFKKTNTVCDPNTVHNEILDSVEGEEDIVWDPEEIDAISSLFRGRIPQKPGKLNRERPLPLPLPYKLRPLGLPTAKKRVKLTSQGGTSSRSSVANHVYKNPEFLVLLAKEIRSLSSEEDVSAVLDNWVQFLRKGSLSLTIKELGRMGLPERALQTFCWAQKQPGLFPDDRSLASTIEILARSHELKIPFDLDKLTGLASRGVIEAMIRGFIRGGSLNLAWKLVSIAKNKKRVLDTSIYAKLILELGKNPDKHALVLTLLEELGEREDLKLNQQDCTALMKVCIRLRKFEIAEGLFNWFRESGREPSVVMYTTMIHSRYSEGKPREALPLVWEMEASDCVLDLPAYRVVIKLLAALDDLPRTTRYFSKLKEAGFSPTYDIYRNLIKMYAESGRVAKCKEINRELEMAGFKLDKNMRSHLGTGV
ncbi:Pentatricopeptide repeat [Dillenia turbinata]|uniref:Pentatricopeptide repeat n=1 Tax=Dillenia turbinata TaxID=194707 RepID=A0AAN8WE28_9MAGN